MKFRIGIYSNVMMFQQVLLEILLQFKSLKHYVFEEKYFHIKGAE